MNKPTKNTARIAVGTVLAASAFASLPAQAATATPIPTPETGATALSDAGFLNGGILNGFLTEGILNGGLINGPLINGPLVDGNVLGPLQLGQFQ